METRHAVGFLVFASCIIIGATSPCYHTAEKLRCQNILTPMANLVDPLSESQLEYACKLFDKYHACIEDYAKRCPDANFDSKHWLGVRSMKYMCGIGRALYLKAGDCIFQWYILNKVAKCSSSDIGYVGDKDTVCAKIKDIVNCGQEAVSSCGEDAEQYIFGYYNYVVYGSIDCDGQSKGTNSSCYHTAEKLRCQNILSPMANLTDPLSESQLEYACKLFDKYHACIDDYAKRCPDVSLNSKYHLSVRHVKYICGKGRALYLKAEVCIFKEYIQEKMKQCLPSDGKDTTCAVIKDVVNCGQEAVSSCGEDAEQYIFGYFKDVRYGLYDCDGLSKGANSSCYHTVEKERCENIVTRFAGFVDPLSRSRLEYVCKLYDKYLACIEEYAKRCPDVSLDSDYHVRHAKYICGKGRALYLKATVCIFKEYIQEKMIQCIPRDGKNKTCAVIKDIVNCAQDAVSSCGEDAKQYIFGYYKDVIYGLYDCDGLSDGLSTGATISCDHKTETRICETILSPLTALDAVTYESELDYSCKLYDKFHACIENYARRCPDVNLNSKQDLSVRHVKYICGKGRSLYLKTGVCINQAYIKNKVSKCTPSNTVSVGDKDATCDVIKDIEDCAQEAVSSCGKDAEQYMLGYFKYVVYGLIDCDGQSEGANIQIAVTRIVTLASIVAVYLFV